MVPAVSDEHHSVVDVNPSLLFYPAGVSAGGEVSPGCSGVVAGASGAGAVPGVTGVLAGASCSPCMIPPVF